MDVEEIRNRYLKFFEKRKHIIIPSASIVPENDPTTLFTGAGMQPLLPYLLGEKHPEGTRLVNAQKCFRAEDIEEVGDNRHTTFFEMLGNWSLGDYFKKDQLRWFFEFLTDDLGIKPEKLFVTVFSGDEKLNLPKDTDSAEIWKELFKEKGIIAKDSHIGSEENGYTTGMQSGRIFYYDSKKNWWSRSGTPDKMPTGEPGGPDSEVFYEFDYIKHDEKFGANCHVNCDCGRYMEIGNSVFMEYQKSEDGSFKRLPARNVDFGGGLERITAALLNSPDVFKIDVFKRAVAELEIITGKKYDDSDDKVKRLFRIMADHVRAGIFIAADGIAPGNKERGYMLRRLIRRSVLASSRFGLQDATWIRKLAGYYIETYEDFYTELGDHRTTIEDLLGAEAEKFYKTLDDGLRMFDSLVKDGKITAKEIFDLYQSFGFPEEVSLELARERGIVIDKAKLDELFEKHRASSRAGSEKRFKGGLADTSEMTVRYHTSTHLLNQALREVLGSHVYQKGSNITAERLRFDFPHPQKLTDQEIEKVERIVNKKIKEGLPVSSVQTDLETAYKNGAIGVFGEKYPPQVTVYRVGVDKKGFFSQEICGGPHVKNTADLLGTFKIVKEEAVSRGVRRIKAVLLS